MLEHSLDAAEEIFSMVFVFSFSRSGTRRVEYICILQYGIPHVPLPWTDYLLVLVVLPLDILDACEWRLLHWMPSHGFNGIQ